MSRYLFPIVFFSLAIIIAGINRGFDFSDEGLYVFLVDPNQANEGGIFNYDLFFKLLYHFTGAEFGLLELRIIRLLSYLAGAWALSIFWRNTHSEKGISLEIYLLAILGLLSGYAFLPPSLSYNSITVVLACFWLAIISKRENNWIDFMIVGFLLGLAFYVKITTCLVFGILTLGVSFYKRVFGWKLISGLIIPFVLMELIFFLFLKETGVFRIIVGLELMKSRNEYGYLFLFKYLLVGIFWVSLVFVPFWFAGFYNRKSRVKIILFGLSGILSLISIFIYTSITDEWNHIIPLVTAGIFGFVLGKYRLKNLNSTQLLLLILLIGMPFFLFFGSNVYWLRLGIHYWVFWIFGLLMFFSKFSRKIQNGLKLGIGVISLILVFNGIWLNPFEQEPLWNADHEWEYSSGKSILLSQKQMDLLNRLKEKTDLYSNEQVMAFYRIPGILYLLDRNSPKSPGYWSRSHLNSYFPEGINSDLIIYSPSDSLPIGDWKAYKRQRYEMPNGEEIQVLWR